MLSLFAIVAVGFLLGMRHAVDPDHVIAVSTIVSHERDVRRASWIGAAWGIGHTLTIVLVGSAMILFRTAMPVRIGLAMELAVGVMLILLGLGNVVRHFKRPAGPLTGEKSLRGGDSASVKLPAHGHQHDSTPRPLAMADRWFQRNGLYQLLRPLLVGVVHGLAGSAAVVLLVLSTIPNPRWAVAYLGVFGAGTVLGMTVITLAIGSTVAFSQKRSVRIDRYAGFAAGIVSVAFGLFLTYQIGFVHGLFTSQTHWSPR